MSRIISLLTAAIALAACSNPTSPADQSAATAKAKSALAAASTHASPNRVDRLAAN